MASTYLRYSETPPVNFRQGIVCVGNFDGVHRGHAALLQEARSMAGSGTPVVAITFDPHPLTLLAPERYQPPLTTITDRAALLETVGADHVVILRTTPELLVLSPEYFFETIIQHALAARGMVEGFNFRFGYQRAGSNEQLATWCTRNQMLFREVAAFQMHGQTVSSSRVREALQRGDLAGATELMGRRYTIQGTVGKGAQRGRTIGFPTANLTNIPTLLPLDGVYAARVVHTGRTWPAAANIGPNPTFGEQARKIEVHLLDFTGDLYGTTLQIEFLERLRPTQAFASIEALLQQLHADVAQVRQIALHAS